MLPWGRRMKKTFQPNGARRDIEIIILIISNIEFNAKVVKKDEEVHLHYLGDQSLGKT